MFPKLNALGLEVQLMFARPTGHTKKNKKSTSKNRPKFDDPFADGRARALCSDNITVEEMQNALMICWPDILVEDQNFWHISDLWLHPRRVDAAGEDTHSLSARSNEYDDFQVDDLFSRQATPE